VHHTRHKANGGKTSVTDCVLLCTFHHQVVIHRWGWTLVLNPDGTSSAAPDGPLVEGIEDKNELIATSCWPPGPGIAAAW
jgi:hypothetical protein